MSARFGAPVFAGKALWGASDASGGAPAGFSVSVAALASTLTLGAVTASFVTGAGSFSVSAPLLASTVTYGAAVASFTGSGPTETPSTSAPPSRLLKVLPNTRANLEPAPLYMAPGALLDYSWDWGPWLDEDDDSISDRWVTCSAPLSVGASLLEGAIVTTFVALDSAALEPSQVGVTCTISTAKGRTDSRVIRFIVKHQ